MSNYGICESEKPTMCKVERPSVMIELQRRRDKAVQELSEIDEAISLFSSQPELEKALSVLGRLNINR